MSKEYLKKEGEELQEYLEFRRRGFCVEVEKGKGSKYRRSRAKRKMIEEVNS